jgi:hypothetical protein
MNQILNRFLLVADLYVDLVDMEARESAKDSISLFPIVQAKL